MAKEKLEIEITAVDKSRGALNALSVTIGNLASSAITYGIEALGAGLRGIGDAIGYALSEAMSAEEIMSQLEAVIISTGGAAGITAAEASKLADSLSQVTRFEDDAILKSQALLLTFTNVGQDVFPEATQAILDMSTAMSQDLQTSAIQIGKALNDPIAGMGALMRVGVTFNETQKETIKGLVEGGQVMEAQRLILAELAKEFGGSAVAAGQTFAGQMDITRNTLSNVAESIGTALLPTLTTLAGRLLEFVQSDQFQGWVEQVADWLENKLPVAIQTAVTFWETQLKPALDEWGPILRDDILPMMADMGRILGEVLPPAIFLTSRAVSLMAWIFQNVVLPPINAVKDSIQLVYDGLVKLKNFIATPEGQGIFGNMATTGNTIAGLANPFVGGANLLGGGLGSLVANGAGGTTVNVQAGSILSFLDESALEAWLRPLIEQWTN